MSGARLAEAPTTGAAALAVHELSVAFGRGPQRVQAVDRVSFTVEPGEVVAIVGESGCGKSATATAVTALLPRSASASGSVRVGGQELSGMSERALAGVRGSEVGMIFQEPRGSLNPVMTVGRQVAEPLRKHAGMGRAAALRRAVELLGEVGIADPERRAGEYPHQLSGGMCQRVMIAMAMSSAPRLLVADEPTTALDATVQATILTLLRDLVGRSQTGLLLITHDLGVVADIADRVIVMYAGRTVEEASVHRLFADARHPYTRALLAATPVAGAAERRLAEIPGMVPTPREPATSCAFAARCPRAREDCRTTLPLLTAARDDHRVACWHPWKEEA